VRLEDCWSGTGEFGDRFLDAQHPYADDLDILGRGSLFELLCVARTPMGEECLAQWLLSAATPDDIRERQATVAELRDKLNLREQFAVVGTEFRPRIWPRLLIAWGDAKHTSWLADEGNRGSPQYLCRRDSRPLCVDAGCHATIGGSLCGSGLDAPVAQTLRGGRRGPLVQRRAIGIEPSVRDARAVRGRTIPLAAAAGVGGSGQVAGQLERAYPLCLERRT
jgi:hypothetical protein